MIRPIPSIALICLLSLVACNQVPSRKLEATGGVPQAIYDEDQCRSPAKAFQMGGRGDPLPTNCSREKAPEFYAAWDSGLRTYCVPEFGYALGRSGAAFNPVCPPELTPAFKAAYDRGRGVYFELQRLRKNTGGLRGRVADLDRALAHNLNKQTHARESGNSEALEKLKQEELMLRNQKEMLESQLWDMQGSINRYEIEK